jgi:hypothetical protein
MGFFSSVQYINIAPASIEEGCADTFEEMADVFLAPYRWLAQHFWDGGKSYQLEYIQAEKNWKVIEKKSISTEHPTIHKVARVFFGCLLLLPGLILGTLAMGLAYISDEVRAKHRVPLSDAKSSDPAKKILEGIVAARIKKESDHDLAKQEHRNGIKVVIQDGKGSWKKVVVTGYYFRKEHTAQGAEYIAKVQLKKCFPYHEPSGEIYNEDPKWLLRIKGFMLLTVGTPIITAVRMVYQAVILILHLTLIQPFKLLDGRVSMIEAKKEVTEHLVDISRAALYGIALCAAAFLTVFAPFTGRRYYGKLERMLNRHEETGPRFNKFYMAICFQRLAIYKSGSEITDKGKDFLFNHLTFNF